MPAMVFAGHHGHHGHRSHYSYSIGIGVPSCWGYDYWAGPYPYYYSYYPYYPSPVYVAPPYYSAVVVERPIVLRNQISTQGSTGDFRDVRIRKVQLLEQLKAGAQAERLQAINELAGFSFDEQVRGILENILLSDPDSAIREEVAVSFGKVKNHAAIGVLEKVRVNDTDRNVREAADTAINQIKS